MTTFATLLTGGDGFGIGARAAGLRPLWGVEINPEIAARAERNSPELSVVVDDVAEINYTALERPWLLHTSTVCKYASIASGG